MSFPRFLYVLIALAIVAIIGEASGQSTGFINDIHGHVVARVSGGSIEWNAARAIGYGHAPGATTPPLGSGHPLAHSFGWRGKYRDGTGLYCLHLRYYNPTTGRFESPDPLGHAACPDLYSAFNGDPTNYFDPDGEMAATVGGGLTQGFLGLGYGALDVAGTGLYGLANAMGADAAASRLQPHYGNTSGAVRNTFQFGADVVGTFGYGTAQSIDYVAGTNTADPAFGQFRGRLTDQAAAIQQSLANATPGEIAGAAVVTVGGAILTRKLSPPTVSPVQAVQKAAPRAVGGAGDEMVDVYRAFGGDSRAQGFSWTTVDPRTVSNFRDVAGLPSGGASGAMNTADFLIKGQVRASDIIKSRPALPLDGNKGGLPELIIDPKNVRLNDFSVLNP
jgi:RHS repeat-associated protein